MATSSAAGGGGVAGGAAGRKTYFKTPEGRHKLQYEKTHSPSVLHYNHGAGGKTISEMMVAYLKEKPAGQGSTPSTPSFSSGMRSAAARLLGTGNGCRALSFVGSNGVSRAVSGSSPMGGTIGTSTSVSGSQAMVNYDGKGMYIIFNTADTLFISDLNTHNKDPIKSIHFSNSNPLCQAFDPEAKDGHDLMVGVWSGDVYSMSLRQQLQDPGKKPVHLNILSIKIKMEPPTGRLMKRDFSWEAASDGGVLCPYFVDVYVAKENNGTCSCTDTDIPKMNSTSLPVVFHNIWLLFYNISVD